MNAPSVSTLDSQLDVARMLAKQRRALEAAQTYTRVLELAPENVEALNFLGMHALNAGQAVHAIELFDRAAVLDAATPQVRCNLGVAYLAVNRLDQACQAFENALKVAPKFFLARLNYGHVLELLGRESEALRQYFSAITQAQSHGRWLDDATTAPALRELVKHAMEYVDFRRRLLFESVLAPLRECYGDDALRRATHCLQIYLGELPAPSPDPRQRPKFLYFPDLPTTAYFPRELFPWYQVLEGNFATIRDELLAALATKDSLEPFLGSRSPEEISGYLRGTGKPAWEAFFFYRHGQRNHENCARCPRTTAILDALPTLVRIRDHAPEVCFSVLTPGTHILPHRGVTNTRLVTHLPLIVPEDCALTVGGEEHVWQEGRCVTFDDTFEHEAWNRSDQTRVVMLLDVWNPHLSEVEREAATRLVERIGDFNRECEIQEG